MTDPRTSPASSRQDFGEALRDTEAKLNLAIQAGRMAVWDFDLAEDRVTASPELNRLLGFAPDATPTTDDIRARYYPGDRERVQVAAREALARGDRFIESDFRYVWPDNSVHWVLLRVEAVLDQNGRPTRALGIAMDITDRKQAEDTLRASETRLRLAQQAAGIGVWDWDVTSGAVTWSQEVYDMLGLERSVDRPASGRRWLEAIDPEDQEFAARVVRRSAARREPFSIEYRSARAGGGGVRWIRSSASPIVARDGSSFQFVGVNIDITSDKLREERLNDQAADLQHAAATAQRERDRIYELSNDLFLVLDHDLDIKVANPAWGRLLDRDDRDRSETALLAIVHPDDRDSVAEALSTMRSGDALQRFECRLLLPDEAEVWISWAALMEDGLTYAVGRNITAEKDRSATLRQSQKMEALGQLTGGIAHDFNNLLQAIGGYLELIRSRSDTSTPLGAWSANALEAVERATRLTKQLLTFSRSQSVDVAAVDVNRVVFNMQDLLERTLGALVKVRLDLGEGRIGASVDRNQLEVALLNLAINARDAMPGGGVLTIETRRIGIGDDVDLASGAYIEIRVGDSGSGMPAFVASRAFDPFFTTKGPGKGTGLGLSQVYGMARQAGGIARIETRPGRGTVVSLILKQVPPPADAGVADDRPSPERRPAAAVLVVDDDPIVRQLLTDMLETLGYAVSTAADGPAALEALERARPDLLLLDFAMPGLDGAEVAAAVRRRHPDLPIVFASGHADRSRIDAIVGQAAPRLHKPFKMEELASTLAAMLRTPA